jgi:hypothetical protein
MMAILFRDTFTEVSDVNLIDHTPEQGGSWLYEAGVPNGAAQVLDNGRLRLNGGTATNVAYLDNTGLAGGYIRFTPIANNASSLVHVAIRYQDISNYYYMFRSGSTGIGIAKIVGGTETIIFSDTSYVSGRDYAIEDDGSTITFVYYDNGVRNVIHTAASETDLASQTGKGFVIKSSANQVAADAYESGTLESPSGLTINSLSDYNAKPRDANGNAVFTVSGECPDPTSAVEYSLDETTWLTLDATPSAGTYTGDVTVNGQQNIFVRSADDNQLGASVTGITSAMSIVLWGQSGCDGRGINNQGVATGAIVPLMYKGGAITQMADPTGITGDSAGSLWPLVVKYFIDQGIPVVMANVAQGGTTVSQWQPSTSLNNRIVDFATNFGAPELAISIIGETDSNGTTKATFKSEYLNIVQTLNTNYGTECYAVKFPVGSSTSTATQSEIREAYDELIAENEFIKFGGDLSVIDIDTGTGHDSLHLKTDEHLAEGDAIIRAALAGLVSEITLDIGAPDGNYHLYLTQGNQGSVSKVYDGAATFSGGSTTISGLPVAAGTLIRGFVDSSDTPALDTGDGVKGVTV